MTKDRKTERQKENKTEREIEGMTKRQNDRKTESLCREALLGLYLNTTLILRQKDRKIIRQKMMMNRTQKTSKQPPMTYSDRKGDGMGWEVAWGVGGAVSSRFLIY